MYVCPYKCVGDDVRVGGRERVRKGEHGRRGVRDRVGSTNCKLKFYYDG